ncbi:OmpA family protein [Aestuariibius sp. 2305UL40-4]|uniref:OmpA family protein n=1 Tax=Aestuariibius violaceus TaxID=3234132 RepID=UPI00345E9302
MTRRTLRSTTALILSLTLAAPLPLAAQDAVVETCPEGAVSETCPPAAEAEGTVTQEGLPQITDTAPEAGDTTTEEGGDALPQVTETTPDTGEDATEEVDDGLPQITDAVPETEGSGEVETTADGAEPAPGGTPADPESADMNADPAPGGTTIDPESTAESELPAVEESAPAETAETPPVADPEVIPAPDTAEGEEAEPTEGTPVETAEPEVSPTEEPPAETAEETVVDPAETDTAETAPAEVEAEGEADVAVETEAAPSETTEEDGIAVIAPPAEGEQSEADVAGTEPEVTQDDTETSTAAANETPEAAATAAVEGEADAEAEVVTETVTEETSRSSDEEFTTSASRSADENDDDDGLSALETFALGAAGLIVLDQIIGRNEQVVTNSGDRVVVQRDDGDYYVLKDDNALLRQPGAQISTRTFDDGSTLQRVLREDGSEVITIRAANGQVLRRSRILPDGTEVLLFDDTVEAAPVEVTELPEPQQRSISLDTATEDELRAALRQRELDTFDRSFTLQQIRQIRAVRELVPVIELDAVTFDTGSSAIRASQADALIAIGQAMRDVIEESPNEVFLVEGHTDAVGSASLNLALSDRRAESVALALAEYFDVPPENLIVQGYGEANLKVVTEDANRENRRATVRRITPLLARLN